MLAWHSTALEGCSTVRSPAQRPLMTSRRYLITGGSGFLGINLIRYLLERGVVRSLDLRRSTTRTADGSTRSSATSATPRPSTRRRGHRHRRALRRGAAAAPAEDIRTTDIDGTRRVLERPRAPVERFIMISSTAVYGIPDHHPLFETDQLVGVGPYGEAKIAAEEVCLEFRAHGPVRADHPAQELRRARAARRLRAVLRLGAHGARLPDDRQRQQPLPAARRRGPLRCHLLVRHARPRRRQRHLQHRRGGVHDDARGLSRRCSTTRASARRSAAFPPRR